MSSGVEERGLLTLGTIRKQTIAWTWGTQCNASVMCKDDNRGLDRLLSCLFEEGSSCQLDSHCNIGDYEQSQSRMRR